MDSAQQRAAVILSLGGAARELTCSMSFNETTEGAMVNGQQEDAVTYLIANLATQFGPLGEESRLQVTCELFEFSRRCNETTDALLSQFLTRRLRATHNVGAALSWEG
eukprot:8855465-Pyramimonas_sp.AAC.1